MVKAYPIDSKGKQIGPVRGFDQVQWDRMVAHQGKKLAWKLSEGEKQNHVIELIETPVSTKEAKKRKNKYEK